MLWNYFETQQLVNKRNEELFLPFIEVADYIYIKTEGYNQVDSLKISDIMLHNDMFDYLDIILPRYGFIFEKN